MAALRLPDNSLVFCCNRDRYVALEIHRHVEFDRATTYLTVLYIVLLLDRAVQHYVNQLPAIGTADFSRNQFVCRHTGSERSGFEFW